MHYWLPAVAAGLVIAATPAIQQNPVGEWRVADGSAHVRIVDCGSALWGVVSWEETPGRDTRNPDPALRTRPTLGMPVLLDMTPARKPDRWTGHVYNADNGRTYAASIEMRGPDTLRVQGCTLRFLCGGENWTRTDSASAGAGGARLSTARRDSAAVDATPADTTASWASAPAAAVCARIGAMAGY